MRPTPVLVSGGAVSRLKVTDEAEGGERVASPQERLPDLRVVWPGVEERIGPLGEHGPACGGEEGERQIQLAAARSRPLVDPVRQLAAVDAQPAHRVLEPEAVPTARAGLELVEETVELALGGGPPTAGVEEWLQLLKVGMNVVAGGGLAFDVVEAGLQPGDDQVKAEALGLRQRQRYAVIV